MVNTFESYFLNSGLSWTMSKVLPYLLMLIIGFIVVKLTKKILKDKGLLKWIFRLTVFVTPFVVYFILNPIYEGDFTNGSVEKEYSKDLVDVQKDKLIVVTIPNCPYCYEAIDRMKMLKERNPELDIEYVIIGAEDPEQNDPRNIDWYNEKGEGAISVRYAENPLLMNQFAANEFGEVGYPTFMILDKKEVLVWPNQNFGVRALDEVELLLN